jgi:hypothetical protein
MPALDDLCDAEFNQRIGGLRRMKLNGPALLSAAGAALEGLVFDSGQC